METAIKYYPVHVDWEVYKNSIISLKESKEYESDDSEIIFARSFCHAVIKYLWRSVDLKKKWPDRTISIPIEKLNLKELKIAKEIADYFISLNIMEYAYLLGNVYTMLLPNRYRADNGIYYTPPRLAERLLDILAAEGADWAEADILDPACGGGAFLITVANRMLGDYRIKNLLAVDKLVHLERHLTGFEIDPFAGWITQVLLDIIVYPETVLAKRRLKAIIKIQDTIECVQHENKTFDIIIGNPPYGRIKLDESTRNFYARSLYGHANLYGVFIDAALRLRKDNGLIGFVTPTSFLGGKYFSNLRQVLAEIAPPLAIDFVSVRAGVFEQVLQETCLITFGENPARTVTTNKIHIENNSYNIERIGSFKINAGVEPWMIAREPSEAIIVNKLVELKTTLKDYGYKVSTGQLVWNRFKEQIFDVKVKKAKPIIWAEAILKTGEFTFNYQARNKMKYMQVLEKQDFLVCKNPVILVQRTTAKEQNKRLQACLLPHSFIEKWGGVVIENHVNIIHSISETPIISLEAMLLILNSQIVDRIFRCLSGSVAVSATELYAIPLPEVEKISEIENVMMSTKDDSLIAEQVNNILIKAYGLEYGNE